MGKSGSPGGTVLARFISGCSFLLVYALHSGKLGSLLLDGPGWSLNHEGSVAVSRILDAVGSAPTCLRSFDILDLPAGVYEEVLPALARSLTGPRACHSLQFVTVELEYIHLPADDDHFAVEELTFPTVWSLLRIPTLLKLVVEANYTQVLSPPQLAAFGYHLRRRAESRTMPLMRLVLGHYIRLDAEDEQEVSRGEVVDAISQVRILVKKLSPCTKIYVSDYSGRATQTLDSFLLEIG